MKKKPLLLLTLLVLFFSILLRVLPVGETPEVLDPATEVKGTTQEKGTHVTRVIDGDTIELETGEKVRYIGIDTPELRGKNGVECFAEEATQKNQELVEGKMVQLQKDVSDTDRYGRLLRYVSVDNEMVNQTLVAEGFAHASAYPPDVAYQTTFEKLEEKARSTHQGLWDKKACSTSRSADLPIDLLITQLNQLLHELIQ